ncbi:MAG: hypothetical protein ACRC62_13135 [Microcoleus sp.]
MKPELSYDSIKFQAIWKISYCFNKPGVQQAASSDFVFVSSKTLMAAIDAVKDKFKDETGFELTRAERSCLSADTMSMIVVLC